MTPKITDIETIRRASQARIVEEQREHAPETIVEPLFTWQGIARFLDNKPKPQEYIFDGLLPAKIVGALFATGGVGKTSLALQLAACLATGTPFGPFRPIRPTKVLFIGGEDAEDVFHRRLHVSVPAMGLSGSGNMAAIREPLVRQNLEVVSLVGQDKVLTALDDRGNPTTTEVYGRLLETIRGLDGLELLIIDPKSRFDGLNENDNSHATFFVACLEKLVTELGITVLFSHHESKATVKEGEVKASSGRGASALRDGVRWALSLGEMGEKEAEKYGVEAHQFIEAAITKNNYAAKLNHTVYFRRDQDGVLSPANLHTERLDAMAEALVKALAASEGQFTRRDLAKAPDDKKRADLVKAVLKFIADLDVDIGKKDLPKAIDHAIFRGLLVEEKVGSGKIEKKVLTVTASARARFPSNLAGMNDDEEKAGLHEQPAKDPKPAKKGKK